MNRNAPILALALAVAAGLAAVWWATSGSSGPGSPIEAAGDRFPADQEAGLVLDREIALPEAERPSEPGARAAVAPEDPALPPLVSGIVLDEANVPVGGALVTVTESGAAGRTVDPTAILASGRTDERGIFEILATVRPLNLLAYATKDGHLESEPGAFQRGATDVRLVVRKGGLVSGRVLLDPWVRPEWITFGVSSELGTGPKFARGRPVANSSVDKDDFVFRLDGEGRFAVGGFKASTIALSVQAKGDPWNVVTIPDALVTSAPSAPDARLDPLDLRGRFELLAVDVLDDAGNKCVGARVVLRNPDSPGTERSQFAWDGRAEFFTAVGPHDLEVERDGFRSARLESVSGNQVIRLRRGIPVLVRLRGKSVRPAPPDLLAVGFVKGSRARHVLDGLGVFRDPVQTSFLVASPGPHEVAWYLERGSVQAYLETGAPQTVDVRDQEAVQEFVLEVPALAESAWIDRVSVFERIAQEKREHAESRGRFEPEIK